MDHERSFVRLVWPEPSTLTKQWLQLLEYEVMRVLFRDSLVNTKYKEPFCRPLNNPPKNKFKITANMFSINTERR
jgi:hypothetical protein